VNINIEETVKGMFSELLDIDCAKIKNDLLLIEDLAIDSFGFAELSFIVKEKFNFEISTEDTQGIKTVNDLICYIKNNLGRE